MTLIKPAEYSDTVEHLLYIQKPWSEDPFLDVKHRRDDHVKNLYQNVGLYPNRSAPAPEASTVHNLSSNLPYGVVPHKRYKARVTPTELIQALPAGTSAEMRNLVKAICNNVMSWNRTPEALEVARKSQRAEDDKLHSALRKEEKLACDDVKQPLVTPKRFQFPDIPEAVRLQYTDGVSAVAPLLCQYRWSSLHPDTVVLTPLAWATSVLVAYGVNSPERAGDFRLAESELDWWQRVQYRSEI